MGLRGITVKKFFGAIVVLILLISCTGCTGKLYEKTNDVAFDNIRFSSENMLNSFNKRLNTNYKAYVISECTFLNGRNNR